MQSQFKVLINKLKTKLHAALQKSSVYDAVSLYPIDLKIDVIEKSYKSTKELPPYSIITPVLNEEKSIIATLRSLEAQSHKPDEVIIVDGGSTDDTIVRIEEFLKHSSISIIILTSPTKRNIGAQRNMAIISAKNELLLNADAGTVLDQNYAADMIGSMTKGIDLVGGVHYPKTKYMWSRFFCDKVHFDKKLKPYGACILYKKSIALQAGLYPEYLSYAGEDTFFGYKYLKHCKHIVLNRKPFILWEHPPTFIDMIKKKLRYAKANFEIGLWPYFYHKLLHYGPIPLIVRFTPIYLFFKAFTRNQAMIEIEHRGIKGLVFIFAKNSINSEEELKDYAMQMIADKCKVFFISNQIPKQKYFVDIDHSLLEFSNYKDFSLKEIEMRYGEFLRHAVFVIDSDSAPASGIKALKKRYKKLDIEYLEKSGDEYQ